MSVYVDDWRQPAKVRNGRRVHDSRWSHLYADTTEELIAFAVDVLGLRAEYIQRPGQLTEHFDVTDPKRAQAIARGAIPVSWRHTAYFLESKRLQREAKNPTREVQQ